MRDSFEKLDLMINCYFGSWHPITNRRFRDKGIGTNYCLMESDALNILEGISIEKFSERLRNKYEEMCQMYSKIPFKQLDELDSDFSTLFEFRKILPLFGKIIEDYIRNPTEDGYNKIGKIKQEFVKADRPKYETKIKSLFNRLVD